jgi:hypothetical protein
MQTFRKKLDQLERMLSARFSELLSERKSVMFNTKEDLEQEIDEYFHCRNDITGDIFDVAVLFVSGEGIKVIEVNDMDQEYFVRFQDLAFTIDRVNIIEKIENRKPLFLTEDGKEVFEGDTVWIVSKNNLTVWSRKADNSPLDSDHEFFSSKDSADEYVFRNKPCLSFNDIWNTKQPLGVNVILFEDQLKGLVKSKL